MEVFKLFLDCICGVWLFSRACLSLSPAPLPCVHADPEHGLEVSLKCPVSSTFLSVSNLDIYT